MTDTLPALGIQRVKVIALAVTSLERANRFYEETLGLAPAFEGAEQVGLAGFPEFRATLLNTWEISDFAFNYNIRHIDENGRYSSQTLHDVQGSWQTPWNGTRALRSSHASGGA